MLVLAYGEPTSRPPVSYPAPLEKTHMDISRSYRKYCSQYCSQYSILYPRSQYCISAVIADTALFVIPGSSLSGYTYAGVFIIGWNGFVSFLIQSLLQSLIHIRQWRCLHLRKTTRQPSPREYTELSPILDTESMGDMNTIAICARALSTQGDHQAEPP